MDTKETFACGIMATETQQSPCDIDTAIAPSAPGSNSELATSIGLQVYTLRLYTVHHACFNYIPITICINTATARTGFSITRSSRSRNRVYNDLQSNLNYPNTFGQLHN